MKSVRKIGALALIGIFIISTIGITVYKHYCHSEGVSISYFSPVEHSCANEKKADNSIEDCCHKAPKKSNCCSDEVESYKIDSDYHQVDQSKIKFHALILIPFKWILTIFNFEHSTPKTVKSTGIHFSNAPPLSSSLSFLRFIQVWRI